jgi:CHASE3 domain sensor protein
VTERSWTFGQKVGAGFAAMVGLVLILAAVASVALKDVTESKDQVLAVDGRNLIHAANLASFIEMKGSTLRGYLLIRDEGNLAANREARREFLKVLPLLRTQVGDPECIRLLTEIERLESVHQVACEHLISMRAAGGTPEAAGHEFQEQALPLMNELRRQIHLFVVHQEQLLEQGTARANAAAERATSILAAVAFAAVALAIAVGWGLTTTLGRQIGSAVQHVQSSSSNLRPISKRPDLGSSQAP